MMQERTMEREDRFMSTNSIVYFDETGEANTWTALEVSKKRALELGIKKVLVASSHGFAGIEAAKVFAGTGIEVIAVTISEGYQQEGWCMTAEERRTLQDVGVKVLTTQHGLSGGVGEALLGEHSPMSIVANTFYCFSQGMKVAVEIAIMAAEAGLIPTDKEVISLGGTSEGADTAIVLAPAYAAKFKDLRILEILCKPRIG
jgi:hypothetical protein